MLKENGLDVTHKVWVFINIYNSFFHHVDNLKKMKEQTRNFK